MDLKHKGRINGRYVGFISTLLLIALPLVAFDCQPAEDPCANGCSDNDGTPCLLIPEPTTLYVCDCECEYGTIGIFFYDDATTPVDTRFIPNYIPREGGKQWCSAPTVPTCQDLVVDIEFKCEDYDCTDYNYRGVNSPFAVEIPCGKTALLYVTFNCPQIS